MRLTSKDGSSSDGSGAEFDQFAANYDDVLQKGLSASGENKDFFIHGRVCFLTQCIKRLSLRSNSLRVMDFGCGTGSAIPELTRQLAPTRLVGIDVSATELEIARTCYSHVSFFTPEQYQPVEGIDVVYCNGTFHHIPPLQRPWVLDFIRRSLKPGGLFALWENNPWNPGTRYVMSRIPFDRDAIMLSIPQATNLIKANGFECLRQDSFFTSLRHWNFFGLWSQRYAKFRWVLNIKFLRGDQYDVHCHEYL